MQVGRLYFSLIPRLSTTANCGKPGYEARYSPIINPIHPIGNSLKKQKSMYIVLTPVLNPLYKIHKLMGILWAHMGAIGLIGLINVQVLPEGEDLVNTYISQ